MRAPDWLTARPVAHRGLHDAARGIIENMPARGASRGRQAISPSRCDIQLTADGEAMVHHDDALGRLTEGSGALLGKTAAELRAVKFKDTSERMMSLGDLCALVAGRVPLVIEVKSHFDGDRKLVKRMAEVLASYSGPVVGMSFDPDQVLALREIVPKLPRGIVAQRNYDDDYWKKLTPEQRDSMLLSAPRLSHRAAFRRLLGQPVAGAGALDRPQHLRLSAAGLDGAHAGAARTGGALCRPDDFRGFRAGNLTCWLTRLEVARCDARSLQGVGHHARWLIVKTGPVRILDGVIRNHPRSRALRQRIPAAEWDACANPRPDPNSLDNLDTLASGHPAADSCTDFKARL